MKKLLLLSALLIFACSSDDEGNGNNNNSSRLVESITILSANISTGNYWFQYDNNNRIISFEWQNLSYSSSGELVDESVIYLVNLEYIDNVVQLYGNDSFIGEFALTENRHYDIGGWNFDNGYLQSIDYIHDDNECTEQYSWVNDNLVESYDSCEELPGSARKQWQYSNHTNKIGAFMWWWGGASGYAILQYLSGWRGIASKNLPSIRKECYSGSNPNLPLNQENCQFQLEQTHYSYEFDSQGYPIVINHNYDNSSYVSAAVTYFD